jgi:hypothetical protein
MTPPNTPTPEKSVVEQLQETVEWWNRFLRGSNLVPSVKSISNRAKDQLQSIFGRDSDVVKAFESISDWASKEADPQVGVHQLILFLSSVIDSLRIGVISDIRRIYQPPRVFVGHGRSSVWSRVVIYLRDEHQLEAESYETASHTSEHIVDILKDYLDRCNVAVIVMTADDVTALGTPRARQIVIQESGLFQGRHGFGRVFLLQEARTEDFFKHSGIANNTIQRKNRGRLL